MRRARPVRLVTTLFLALTAVSLTAGCGAGHAPTPALAPSSSPGAATRAAGDTPLVATGLVIPTTATAATATAPFTANDPGEESRVNIGGDTHPIVPREAIGTIEIPRIRLIHPIYEGIDLPTLHWGPGHWPGSVLPGQYGNTVFAGHRVTHTRPFSDIDRLVPGDQIIFTTAAGRFVYEVTGHQIVTPDQVHIVDPTLTPTVTLTACHPKGSDRQRYVIRGRLIGRT